MAINLKFNVPQIPQSTNTEIQTKDPDGTSGNNTEVMNIQSAEYVKALIKRLNANTNHRACLVEWIKDLIPIYLILVFFLVLFNGLTKLPFYLSDEVLITILSTTTINVIGLAVIVLKGLFNIHDNQQ